MAAASSPASLAPGPTGGRHEPHDGASSGRPAAPSGGSATHSTPPPCGDHPRRPVRRRTRLQPRHPASRGRQPPAAAARACPPSTCCWSGPRGRRRVVGARGAGTHLHPLRPHHRRRPRPRSPPGPDPVPEAVHRRADCRRGDRRLNRNFRDERLLWPCGTTRSPARMPREASPSRHMSLSPGSTRSAICSANSTGCRSAMTSISVTPRAAYSRAAARNPSTSARAGRTARIVFSIRS